MRRLLALFSVFLSLAACGQMADSRLFEGMKFRQVGPFRGGRSIACSGVPGRPNEWYMGTCGGGLWKSDNDGEDWKCVTDGFLGVGTVGAICVSPNSPDVIYIGTGEKDIRGNISHGDGIYKSSDGGKTWSHSGLRETQTISRIAVHPQNPDIVWVAALGHVYGKNKERGIYKSTDGGKTWIQTLFVSETAGAADIIVDVNNPKVLYASTWEAWRTPYSLNSGGPGSKLWKSADGGDSWTDISKSSGLPGGVWGKIGVAVSPVDSNRVYAIIEAHDGGIFRSDNTGESWTMVNNDREYRQRAWYYSRIVADSQERDTVYVLNLSTYKSKDAGVKFTGIQAQHGDCHDLWIDPKDNKRMIKSDDGGATVKVDGKGWTPEDYPTAQFYHVSADNAFPYHILGAQQDNSTVRLSSVGGRQGIGPNDWTSTAGGESGYVTPKPNNPEIVFGGSYGGDLSMLNHKTGESRAVDPWPDNPMGHGVIDSKFRFQWTFPIVFSPHDPEVLYTCSQHVMKTTNGGESWQVISPDLTRNDPKTLQSSGGPITQDNTGVEYYGTVFTVAESPIKKGVIWAGSDDGLVHISQNGGKSWEKITPNKMPVYGLCSMLDASPHAPGRAWLAVDNHENDDYSPYVYKTEDFGKTWTLAISGLPKNSFVRVVREDPERPNMVYCGTETGLYLSYDGGKNWQPLQLNLPVVPVHDLIIKNSDLILATHGRSFWVLDNITSLRQFGSVRDLSKSIFFKPRTAARTGGFGFGGRQVPDAPGTQYAENPPTGIIFDYYLPSAVTKVSGVVRDKSGATIATLNNATTKQGFNRTTVSALRYPGIRTFPGMVTWAMRSGSVPAPPGDYFVELDIDGTKLTQSFHYGLNPGSSATEADLREQFELASKIVARATEANNAVVIIRDVYKKTESAVKEKPELDSLAKPMIESLSLIENEIYQTKSKASQDPLNYPIKLNDKIGGILGVVLSGNFKPTKQSYEVFEILSSQLQVQLDELKKVRSTMLNEFNKKLKALGLTEIIPIDPAAKEVSLKKS